MLRSVHNEYNSQRCRCIWWDVQRNCLDELMRCTTNTILPLCARTSGTGYGVISSCRFFLEIWGYGVISLCRFFLEMWRGAPLENGTRFAHKCTVARRPLETKRLAYAVWGIVRGSLDSSRVVLSIE